MKSASKQLVYWFIAAGVVLSLSAVAWVWYAPYRDQPDDTLQNAINQVKEGQFAEAAPVIRSYADRGNLNAKRILAHMHAFGLGVPYSEELSIRFANEGWSEIGSPGGHEFYVAKSYIKGDGVDANVERGMQWLARAAASGSIDAQRLLASPEQLKSFGGTAVNETVVQHWKARIGDNR